MSNVETYPLLCTINSGKDDDGVSRVSNLLWQVLSRATDRRCRHLNLLPEGKTRATASDKLKFARRMLNEHLRGRIEWIMYDHLGPARIQGLIPRQFVRPYALFLHSVEAWSPLSAGRKRILRDAQVRIANSHYTAQHVAAAHPEIGAIEVCHLALPPLHHSDFSGHHLGRNGSGPDSSTVSPVMDETETALLNRINAHSVLIVGRMVSSERHKGHEPLIEIWQQVTKAVPDAQLLIVGGGDDVPRLKNKAAQAAPGESIIFAGHVNDSALQQLYRRAAVFCMPSSSEGFGLVYLEAMRHRLPCIASPDNAATEVVLDGETGFLVQQSETAQLAAAIIELLKNPARRREMGEAGYERWQKVFSFENFEHRLLSILEHAALLKTTSISLNGKRRK
jgi:phosphatidylinositol alpha-1,6-mannosyltransferase